jgi:hypothetical protein
MANTKITNPELFNLGDSTSATQLPVMTTIERIAMNAAPTFNIDYLVVAGGGGGGMGYYGGGGGAGGLLTNVGGTSLVLAAGGSGYTITVGDGGSGAASKTVNGTNGSNSRFNAIEAYGGGGAASRDTTGGSSGGSGGGAANPNAVGGSGTVGQGNDGGTLTGQRYGSGGGGANQAGQIPPQTYSQTPQNYSIGAPGGNGLEVNITGVDTFYAGGGGGGARATYSPNGINGGLGGGGAGGAVLPGSNGIDELGGGGGGGGFDNDSGGSGGSGIVILRYPTADIASYTATGLTPTETTDGTDTVLSFTTVGTGTISFTSSTPTGTISTGEMIFNSDTDKVEYFDGTKWYGITYEALAESPYSAVIWQGTGTTNPRTGVGFQPDLIWVKNIDVADSSAIVDSVRGISSPAPYLASNLTSAQNTSTNMPTSVQLDGFTITGNGGRTNSINEDYVAWCFKAGGTAVPNTNGSRPSQVSANVAGGFSIVSWSGNSTNPSTVGHGLGVAPELFIIKNLSSAVNWSVYSSSVGAGKKLLLNSTSGATATSNYANTSPTSSVFSLSGGNEVNGSGNYIAYCFHSVAGISKIGSYQGNGLTNGPTVALDFEPSFLMCKETSNTGSWRIMDSTRQPSNPKSNGLWANLSNAESTSATNVVNFNSDNFQVVGGGSDVNASGQTYMYLAFA